MLAQLTAYHTHAEAGLYAIDQPSCRCQRLTNAQVGTMSDNRMARKLYPFSTMHLVSSIASTLPITAVVHEGRIARFVIQQDTFFDTAQFET